MSWVILYDELNKLQQKNEIIVLSQNLTQSSVDQVLASSTALGLVLNRALWLDTPEMEALKTIQEIIDSSMAMTAIAASNVAVSMLTNSRVARPLMVDSDTAMTAIAASDQAAKVWLQVSQAMVDIIHSDTALPIALTSTVLVEAITNSAYFMSIVSASSRALNLVVKNENNHMFAASPYFQDNMALMSSACEDTAYFTVKPVAENISGSGSLNLLYHHMDTNKWDNVAPVQQYGIYFIKTTRVSRYSNQSATLSSVMTNGTTVKIFEGGTGAVEAINLVAMGALATTRGYLTPAWPESSTHTTGVAYLAI